MPANWLDELNDPQREAVTYGDGPLLVVAGAGTGKTKTLACRVAWLIEQGVRPERILLLTFTRRAAAEMLRRAERLVGEGSTGKVWGGTFHAVSNRLLRLYGRAVDLPPDFTVIDQSDAGDVMNLIRSDLGLGGKDRRFPQRGTLVNIYSRTVNAQQPLGEVVQKHFPWCKHELDAIADVFERYVARKREHHVLDFDDLLLYWSALTDTEGAGRALNRRFDHILVDEYQDTNAVQAEILQGMTKLSQNICVVGDDAQSIYGFRAASVRNILDFPEQFDGTHVVKLEQNYRSTQPILDASNAVMEKARERFTKNLWSKRTSAIRPALCTCTDETHQTQMVCEHILSHLEQGVPLMHQAVLFRASHHSAELEIELTRRNVPFHKYGGLKFIESAHIKDVVAVLRILENPFDQVSWFRVLQLLEGIGPKKARAIMERLMLDAARESSEPRASARAESPAESDLRNSQMPPAASADADAQSEAGAEPDPADELLDDSVDIASFADADAGSVSTTGTPAVTGPLARLVASPPKLAGAAAQSLHALVDVLAACCGYVVCRPDAKPAPPAVADEQSRGVRSAAASKLERPRVPGPATRRRHSSAARDLDAPRLEPAGSKPTLPEQIDLIRVFYGPIAERVYSNADARLRDVEQLSHIAARFRSRRRFVTDLTLDPPAATSDLAQPPFLEEDYLVLSTIHSAKGCEWDVVHIIHAADGMIPSDMATGSEEEIEEERRLLYVAMTRAKDMLYVYFPLRYYHHRFGASDAHNYAQLTRFIPPEAYRLFEQRVSRSIDDDLADGDDSGESSDVSARLNRLWTR
ncbi:MAG: ATP-dependent helicase [Phycisphaerales bacterium]|nr:MAG: ATP-dependent helicase [Phycisphaerales bacterium]